MSLPACRRLAVRVSSVSAACLLSAAASASTIVVPMRSVDANGVGASIGTVTASDTPAGLSLTTALSGLPPGEHGFHVHQNASCEPGPDADKAGAMAAAFAAGGHLDPDRTGQHLGPAGAGHRGDLPSLTVDRDGHATTTVIAPHLAAADLAGHALMIHAGGDNYADQPTKLGGGGGRIACGVVP